MNDEPLIGFVHDELFKRRVLQLSGRLDELVASDLCAQLLSLDALGDEPIHLLFSSPGGSIVAALSLVDVIDVIGVQVHASAIGQVSGAGVAPFAACARRRCAPRASFVLAEEPTELAGAWQDLVLGAQHRQARLEVFARRIADSTKSRHSESDVLADLKARRRLGPQEAVAYGLVDELMHGGGALELLYGGEQSP